MYEPDWDQQTRFGDMLRQAIVSNAIIVVLTQAGRPAEEIFRILVHHNTVGLARHLMPEQIVGFMPDEISTVNAMLVALESGQEIESAYNQMEDVIRLREAMMDKPAPGQPGPI